MEACFLLVNLRKGMQSSSEQPLVGEEHCVTTRITAAKETMKNMESDKTPGTDGLPAEFYKAFWSDLSSYLISALNYGFDSGHLSVSQRRGVIKLIPKKDAELYFIKNWRPITL